MSCKTVIEKHVFKTIGEFEGKPVSRCTNCPLTIVDFASLGNTVVAVELNKKER